MRILHGGGGQHTSDLAQFSKWRMDIGDGQLNNSKDDEVEIDIPADLLIHSSDNDVDAMVRVVYGLSYTQERDPKFFQGHAILSPRNSDVDVITRKHS